MIVEQLLATLGLKVDPSGFIEAEGKFGKLKAAFAGLLSVLGIRELKDMVGGVADAADASVKASQKVGISVEAIQELGYAAKLSDVSQQGLESSLGKLGKTLEKLGKTGKGPGAEALKALGVNFKQLKGEAVDANLEVIADAFQRMPDGLAKLDAARKLFGSSGAKMIPFLNSGSAGIRELREEAQKLGVVVSGETAKAFEEFNDDQTRVSEAWRGMRVEIVTALLPAIHEMVSGLLDWLKANRDVISVALHVALTLVVTAFKVLGTVLSEAIGFAKTLAHFFAEYPALAVLLATALLTVLVPAIVAWTAASLPALAVWIAFNAPLLLVIALITALVLVVNHWSEIWPRVTQVVKNAWKAIEDAHVAANDFLVRLLTGPLILDAINFLFDATVEIFSGLVDKIGTSIKGGFEFLVEEAKKLPGRIWEAISDSFSQLPGGVMDFIRGQMESKPFSLTPQTSGLSSEIVPEARQMSATFGGVQIQLSGVDVGNHETLSQMIADKVESAQRTMLTDAYDAYRGGQR